MRGWVAVVVACVCLISCGGGGGSAGGGSSGQQAGAGGSAGGGAGGLFLTVRLAHTFLPAGTTTGPALDIYDDMYGGGLMPSLSGKPIIAGLAYGTMSGYLKPRFVENGGMNVQLVALLAGSSPNDTTDAMPLWEGTDDGSHPQVTLLLDTAPPYNGNPLSGITWTDLYEKGDEGLPPPFTQVMGPLAPAPPAGQGEYLVTEIAANVVASGDDFYFFVDDSCTPALNGDVYVPGPLVAVESGPASYFCQFPASPGTHQLSVAPWSEAETPTCAQLLAVRQGTTPVNVAAGQQIIAFIYGSSLTDLHLVTGPIAP